MSELNACFGRWQLKSWPEQEAQRWANWRLWEETLSKLSEVEIWNAAGNISPFVFPIAVPAWRFNAVTQAIMNRGVEVRSLMGGAMHRHPAFSHLAHHTLLNCESLGARTFFVGLHQTLLPEQVQTAAQSIKMALQQK